MKNTGYRNTVPLTMMEKPQGYEAFYQYSDIMESPEFHCHDFYEFYIHVRGGQYFGLDNELYLLKPNQLYIIPPFSMHGLSNFNELHGYERAFVNVSLEVLKTLGCGQMDLDRRFRACASQGLYSFQLSDEDAAQCLVWIKQLQQNPPAEDALKNLSNFSILLNLMLVICRAVGSASAVSGDVISNGIIQNVLTYINSNYTQPLKMEDLARRFGISVSYLSHEFMKFTNRSVYEYVLYRRVMLARQMMQGSETLNGIAYQCGFNDYSNFLRIFNKIVGVSPSAYRKQLTKVSQSGQVS